ncbi:DNA topoisomerase 2-like [Iris pallida]|uniref:DNA topoisomerase (ATP-hydrolyzing) n=1 Tax=Iris pallida TaxID=29817 RepID=A0AAX6DIH7_IRIPA|nr:DNA topoisomerase 2-like [Iris pallida]
MQTLTAPTECLCCRFIWGGLSCRLEWHYRYTCPLGTAWKVIQFSGFVLHVLIEEGLGTSTSTEGKEYFTDLGKHKKDFVWAGEQDGYATELAFSKKKIEERKNLLRHFEAVHKCWLAKIVKQDRRLL